MTMTMTGWLFASFRGRSMSFFYLVPMPMRAANNAAAGKAIDGWHQAAEWALLALIVNHGGGADPPLHLSRPRHGADAAGINPFRPQ